MYRSIVIIQTFWINEFISWIMILQILISNFLTFPIVEVLSIMDDTHSSTIDESSKFQMVSREDW